MQVIKQKDCLVVSDDILSSVTMSLIKYSAQWKDVVKIEEVSMRSATFFDVYVRNEERYQIIETNRELFNMLQSHISK